jgi:thioredoxin-dependent peroxiredoxin
VVVASKAISKLKEDVMALLDIGSEAPGFILPNQHGQGVSLSDHAGKNVLVWFFPRAFGNN